MAISIVPKLKERSVQQNVVEHLEEILSLAKDGKITGIASVVANSDGSITTTLEDSGSRFAISHGVSALAFRIHADSYKNAEEGFGED